MAETTINNKGKNRILAVILSFFISGLGHIYIGKIGLGILLLILPYSLFIIGSISETQISGTFYGWSPFSSSPDQMGTFTLTKQ